MKLIPTDDPQWPSRDNSALIRLTLSTSDLERRFGLQFKDDRDDLGPLQWAAAEVDGFGSLLFVIYLESSNRKQVVLYVDRGKDPSEAHAFVVEHMGLTEDDIAMSHSDIES